MEIIYLGHSSFRISSSKDNKTSIVTDPYDSSIGLKFPKVAADIVTVSHDHSDHNNSSAVEGVRKVIKGPGEYEIGGVSILGMPSYHDNEKGATRGKNTIYVIEMDGLRLAHLGDLGHALADETYESLGDINVLFIPVGGHYTIDSSEAVTIAQKIEPNIIIPMHYKVPGLHAPTFASLETEEPYVTKMGMANERLNKLVIKDVEMGEEQKVVILTSRS